MPALRFLLVRLGTLLLIASLTGCVQATPPGRDGQAGPQSPVAAASNTVGAVSDPTSAAPAAPTATTLAASTTSVAPPTATAIDPASAPTAGVATPGATTLASAALQALGQVAWPLPDWQSSSPEAQGMDSAALVRLLQHIRDQDLGVHSLLVARHGVLVLEAYFHPYGPETRHAIYSATKSFSSALIGIAIADGAIPSVDTPLLDLFPGRSIANVDQRKRQITLQHLLTMSSGLDWRRPPGGIVPVRQWELSDDRVQFVLDRPVVDEPGSTFFYNSGGSHLLSAIVQECTGMSAAEYARIKLFEPLGVVDVQWQADPQGISEGSNGLWLRPRDMARFGLLHLRRGEWNGRQVLPASWMDIALSSRITLPQEGRHGFEPSPDLTGYGYQWWITPFGAALAMGYGGQEIIVVPEHDLVVVVTGSSPEVGPSTPEALTRTFIIPAVTSSTPSPENPAAYSRLVDLAAAASSPTPAPVAPLPAIAAEISGTTYRLESPAEPGSESLTLVFGPEPATAWLDLQRGREHITTVVGLYGVYRVTPVEGGQVTLRGHWRDDTTFVLDMDRVGEAAREIGELTFSGDRLQVVYRVAAEGREFVLEGGRVAD